ncbi:Response regulator [Rhodovastum atsumiense]|uniref:response regulator n=1 Tax=Rhodovastum atsumiense TaxID=504468 RepID=UPI00139F2AB0|nr:response regulator [Rhodovastum atsumiense]CAH2599836.1 Response regulator [Rhodovastum atsumiense]
MALRSGEHFDVLFSDVVLPSGVSGITVAREAQRLQPELRILLTSGYAREVLAGHGATEAMEVLCKPYHHQQLLERVNALAARPVCRDG